jgi:hypothetical protein
MKKILLIAALALPTAPALGAERGAKSYDPDKMICRTMTETGSRLSKKKMCMTASQWSDHKRQTQQAVDKAQTQQVNKQGS